MKSNELKKGNWIASGTEFKETSAIGKVLSIGNDGCEFEQLEVECEESFEWFWKDNYCGIPITEDILPKIGFEFYDFNQREYHLDFKDVTGSHANFMYKFFKNGRVDYYLNGIKGSVKNILRNIFNRNGF